MLSRRPKRLLCGRRFALAEEENVILMRAEDLLFRAPKQKQVLRPLRGHQDDKKCCYSTPPASAMSRIAGSLTKI